MEKTVERLATQVPEQRHTQKGKLRAYKFVQLIDLSHWYKLMKY